MYVRTCLEIFFSKNVACKSYISVSKYRLDFMLMFSKSASTADLVLIQSR